MELNLEPLMIATLFATGFTASFVGVLIGIGGGFLAVPVLLFLGFSPQQAAGTSLLMIVATSSLGAFSYARQKRIDYGLAVRFGLTTIPGAILGANVVKFFTPPVFASVFGFVLLTASLYIMVRPRSSETIMGTPWRRDLKGSKKVYPLAFSIGVLAATLGIGGGTIQVPSLIFLLGVPTHIATATSTLIMVFCSTSGALTHIYVGKPVFWAAAALASGTLVGAPLSARLSKRIRSRTLQRILAAVMFVVGLRLIIEGLSGLG